MMKLEEAPFQADLAITGLIHEACSGDVDARSELLELVYSDLRAKAGQLFGGERLEHTLQPTALVHDVYMWLMGAELKGIKDRWHFLALAGFKMRRLLVDHARHRAIVDRKTTRHTAFDVLLMAFESRCGNSVVRLDELLLELATVHPRRAQLIELRFFAGLSTDEAAQHMGVSTRTAGRMWVSARAWLFQKIAG